MNTDSTASCDEAVATDLQNVVSSTPQDATQDLTLPDDVSLCDSEEGFRNAMAELQKFDTLMFDCEGEELGTRGGTLSVISIRGISLHSPHPPKTFIFDILRLCRPEDPNCSIRPLLHLLASPSIRKVVYDGRMDFCAIWFGYGVPLNNVLDLQIFDMRTRLSEEKEDQRLRRLARFFPLGEIFRGRERFVQLNLLQGLGGALLDNKLQRKPKDSIDHHSWLERPLSDAHLYYAASDVYLIGLLLTHLEESYSLLDDLVLLQQSHRYVTLWIDNQPEKGNVFRSNPFFPLEILDFNSESTRKPCNACQRNLSHNSFPNHLWNAQMGRRFCYVCLIIPRWQQQQREEEERKQRGEKSKRKKQKKRTVERRGQERQGAATSVGGSRRV
ncbi:hypothetical protein V5O48_011633 [Marasmius crinis-equi]|uniref:3'-5' exonuclease domain-containing protein n=1 Tax=Marasmius crinis-equi TaxID=585013 RepID=A0ABR3F520_9AGAR